MVSNHHFNEGPPFLHIVYLLGYLTSEKISNIMSMEGDIDDYGK